MSDAWSILIKYIAVDAKIDKVFILRTSFEIILAFLALKYISSKNVKANVHSNDLSKKVTLLLMQEIEGLIDEWIPESLIPVAVARNEQDKLSGIEECDCCSFDYLNVAGSKKIFQDKAKHALEEYGVGTCGPPGFYGTMDQHLELEKNLAQFFGAEKAILYAQGFAAVSSVIPAFSKKGDIIIHDEAVNYSILSGIKISKSYAFSFGHNDLKDLECILEEVEQRFGGHKQSRKFIIVESLYSNTGKLCDIRRIIDLKKKYKYRLILDNSSGLGANGINGLGTLKSSEGV